MAHQAALRLVLFLMVVVMLLFLTQLHESGVRQRRVGTTVVAVATGNLPRGTTLRADDIKLVAWPLHSPVIGSFTTREAVVGQTLMQAVAMHEPLTESKLAPIKVGAGLPPSIPPGLRALSVRVNDVIGLGPGTRVDVLVTIKDQTESLRRAVVSNIQVLTAGTLYGRENAKDGQPAPASVVTLIVTPDEAEKLTLAQKAGALTLVPRNPTTETNGARRRSLPGAPAPSPPVFRDPPLPAPPPPAKRSSPARHAQASHN